MASSKLMIVSASVAVTFAMFAAGCGQESKSSYPAPNSPAQQQSALSSSGSSAQPAAQPAQSSSSSMASSPAPAPTQAQVQENATKMQAAQSFDVPAGAKRMSGGTYPPAAFYGPTKSGTMYIYDDTSKSVALITNYSSTFADKVVNIADLPNVGNKLNPQHTYTIYYVSEDQATTLPSALPSGR